jgi:hypothetical protein
MGLHLARHASEVWDFEFEKWRVEGEEISTALLI